MPINESASLTIAWTCAGASAEVPVVAPATPEAPTTPEAPAAAEAPFVANSADRAEDGSLLISVESIEGSE